MCPNKLWQLPTLAVVVWLCYVFMFKLDHIFMSHTCILVAFTMEKMKKNHFPNHTILNPFICGHLLEFNFEIKSNGG